MPYGYPKILSNQIINEVVDAIRTKLMAQGEFQNELAYYGYRLEFTVNVTLHARDQGLKSLVKGEAATDIPRPEEGGKLPLPVEKEVQVSGSVELKRGKHSHQAE